MGETAELRVIRAKASEMTLHLICVLLDSLFLILWAVPNLYIGRFIEGLHGSPIDEIVLRCLQVVFGVSTIAPICISLYKDLRIMIKHATRQSARSSRRGGRSVTTTGNGGFE